MLRILAIICDLGIGFNLAISLLAIAYLVIHSYDLGVSPQIMNGIGYLLIPFVLIMRQVIGIHYFHYHNHQLEWSYSLIAFVSLVILNVLLIVAAWLYFTDRQVQQGKKKIARYLWNRIQALRQPARGEATEKKSVSVQYYLALITRNIEGYPALMASIMACLNSLDRRQILYAEPDRSLLRFNRGEDLLAWVSTFKQVFETSMHSCRLRGMEYKPFWRMAIHAIDTDNSTYEEEAFIWELLGCTAEKEALLSQEAQERFNELSWSQPVEFINAGIFSRIGNRIGPQIYRLKL